MAERVAVTDVRGNYSFDGVPPGRYELTIELAGFTPVKREVDVDGPLRLPVETLTMDTVESIVIACGRLCDNAPPEDAWDYPDCINYERNDALIEAHQRGDTSAAVLLRRRYDAEPTFSERHRIAGALLGTPEDGDLWDELEAHAATAVRFPQVDGAHSPDFAAWCLSHGLDPWEAVLDDAARPRVRGFGSPLATPPRGRPRDDGHDSDRVRHHRPRRTA